MGVGRIAPLHRRGQQGGKVSAAVLEQRAGDPTRQGIALSGCRLQHRLRLVAQPLVERGDDLKVAHQSAQLRGRSEEHTSELQSLMRISYAVFCLKKKNKTTKRRTIEQNTIRKTDP